jgi:hypothetical protein
LGLPRQPAIDSRGVIDRPTEDIENEGCPAGWVRSPFVQSVQRYTRAPTENGGRVSNPLFDRCDDDLVIEAVLELEMHEGRWMAEHLVQIRKASQKKE